VLTNLFLNLLTLSCAFQDMNTGYRTKQMLCLPVYDYPGNVAGVLQLSQHKLEM
jgi:hypothetical protein